MAAQIPAGGIHHLRLTVTDVDRSRAFYTGLLGFDVAVESPPDVSVPARADLEQAVSLFDADGVPHGEITALPSFGIYVLPFRDPDNIQLELTAPIG